MSINPCITRGKLATGAKPVRTTNQFKYKLSTFLTFEFDPRPARATPPRHRVTDTDTDTARQARSYGCSNGCPVYTIIKPYTPFSLYTLQVFNVQGLFDLSVAL